MRTKRTTLTDLRYGDQSDNTFDLYLPEGLEEGSATPFFLYLHGGGWISGDKSEGKAICEFLQGHGYPVASMNYSLVTSPATLEGWNGEVTACIKAVIEQLKDYGLDGNQMAIWGYSAGAHIGMLYGFEDSEKPVPVRFIVDVAGPAALLPEVWGNDSIYLQIFERLGNREFLEAYSPALQIHHTDIPVLLAYAGSDTLIGTLQASYLQEHLDASGVENELIWFVGSDHDLADDPQNWHQLLETALEWSRRLFK